ncbi:uncharacterized protein H6S33_010167 [Morchella sextelata]|uniref:uncharacterized protein n=1 Tax=Morchella sextelata TaxID=1174677 RepID=UPI001D052FE8|nr:uncharacterized protein H6S33_010167 [Morchella sextelata]KAH0612115.1 hypothetical protein H6S33_010167 [Morchella sextelata]
MHLKLLRVAIETNPEQQSLAQKRSSELPIETSVNPTSLQECWATGTSDKFCEGDLLPDIIKDILKSIDKDNGMSTTLVQGLGFAHSPRLSFTFSNSVTELTPEIVVTTATTKLPFLLYSTRRHTTRVRKELSLGRCGGSAVKKLLRNTAATKWHTNLDPFDVACLIAMAQEQRSRIRGFAGGWGTDSMVYTVYLIIPNNRQSLHLFTARIPTSYLDALGNIEIEVTDHLHITRETIPVPSGSATQTSNILVDRISEMVELVYAHQVLAPQETYVQDEWDLGNEDTPHSDEAGLWGEDDN